MITREPTRLVGEPRRFRDGAVPAQAMFERQMGEKKILEDNANMRVLRVLP